MTEIMHIRIAFSDEEKSRIDGAGVDCVDIARYAILDYVDFLERIGKTSDLHIEIQRMKEREFVELNRALDAIKLIQKEAGAP
jgi:hypothetical protein